MQTYLRYAVILLYAFVSTWLPAELLDYFGLYSGPVLRAVLFVFWAGVCFSAYLWLPDFLLATQLLRKTILEEEAWLHPIMHELNLRTAVDPAPQLLILEMPIMTVYAIGKNTIVMSRGLLVSLSELEIKAVLAHEYGHLKNKDTLAGSAFEMAILIPQKLDGLIRKFFGVLLYRKRGQSPKMNRWKLIVVPLLGGIGYYYFPMVIILLVILFIFMKAFPYFQLFGLMIWFYCNRVSEFRQDQFAQSLGCGRHLKSALLKIDSLDSGTLRSRIRQLWQSHPMTYSRIRRLEWLDGLRANP